MDYRKAGEELEPVYINRSAVERVSSFKVLCIHITEDISSDEHTGHLVKKSQQLLLFHLSGRELPSIQDVFTRLRDSYFPPGNQAYEQQTLKACCLSVCMTHTENNENEKTAAYTLCIMHIY